MKQVVCVKWGTGYGAEYVNRLYGMVSRQITPPFRLVCLTDDRNGIRNRSRMLRPARARLPSPPAHDGQVA